MCERFMISICDYSVNLVIVSCGVTGFFSWFVVMHVEVKVYMCW